MQSYNDNAKKGSLGVCDVFAINKNKEINTGGSKVSLHFSGLISQFHIMTLHFLNNGLFRLCNRPLD